MYDRDRILVAPFCVDEVEEGFLLDAVVVAVAEETAQTQVTVVVF